MASLINLELDITVYAAIEEIDKIDEVLKYYYYYYYYYYYI